LSVGIVDHVIPEPEGGAQNDWDAAATILEEHLQRSLSEVSKLSVSERLERRYRKFRAMGEVER
ncbi:MAG TPA: acetyl-CoA carboxylase carboxyl transferase subunit alpha, partial [Blastocatellia bacterium]|nr:acetyl-CoA carboxylase carboxyl transferase subunit alpha [Blastocatellia bacterium]